MALTLDQLTLKPASKAQTIEARKRSSVEWAKWLTLEQYLRRDEEAEELDHAKDERLISWVLVPVDDPETLDFLSACETYRREIFVLPANETSAVSSIGYGIASVFTPTKYRGKGYAARMMSLLHFAIAKPDGVPPFSSAWGASPPAKVEHPGIVSVLYSDVGKFYERCAPGDGAGWTIVSPTTTEWTIDEQSGTNPPPHVQFLSRNEAVKVVAGDDDCFKRDLESNGPSSRIHFAFRPTAAWCHFQMHRDDEHPLYISSPPKNWGARMVFQGQTHFIVWTHETGPTRKLIIVHTRATSETFPDLFAAMMLACREEKHTVIESWNLDKSLASVAESLGGRTYERSEHLPAMRWYGHSGEVVWFENTK